MIVYDFAQVKLAKVNSDTIINGCVTVDIIGESRTDIEGFGLDAYVLSDIFPKKDDVGIVLYKNSESKNERFWIGTIKKKGNNENVIESKNGKSIFSVGDGGIFFKNGSSDFTFKNNSFNFTNGNTTYKFQKNQFSFLINDTIETSVAGIIADKSKLNIFSVGKVQIKSGQNLILQSDNGSVFIVGRNNENGTSEKTRYKPVKNFVVESINTSLNNRGRFSVTSGSIDIKLSSGKLSSTELQNTSSLNLDILEGNAQINIGAGSLNVYNNNFKLIDSITFRNGLLASPVMNQIVLGPKSLKMQCGPFALPSFIEIGALNIDIEANGKINIKSKLGINIDTLTKVSISPKLQLVIETLKAEIKATAQTSIETAILDLTKSKMIKAGMKTVAPNPAGGPFIAIKMCPILGVPVAGDVAIG